MNRCIFVSVSNALGASVPIMGACNAHNLLSFSVVGGPSVRTFVLHIKYIRRKENTKMPFTHTYTATDNK